ncbi:MAG: response regulator [Desulfobulbaceae bacterium]|uniref:histidine kinase n=1 Tax=Candidatus Desulfobia pelagia TaxID=2841692 RepID=A0A8J6NDK6_9BACT|nr:response regulator [Candidatus Desulfobia pelagia]
MPSSIETLFPYAVEIEHSSLNKIFDVSAVPIYDEASVIKGVAHFAKDITEQRKLEAQYFQSQKMEALGRLTGGVAHDFNNLLSAILGYSELAVMQLPEGSSIRNDIEQVRKAGERAASLVRQMLAFSRKQVFDMKVIEVNTVIDSLLKMIQRVISEKIEMEILCEASSSNIYADKGQIEQVIMNLAINAKDAMPDGGHLCIKTENRELDENFVRNFNKLDVGNHIVISISDTGIGIPPDILPHIFEPFYTTKEVGKGTGLGLATVYGIIEQHNGTINVYSEPGHGTTFKIYLPVSEKGIDEDGKGMTPFHLNKGTETILVVDDEEPVRSVVRSVLESLGYTVILAKNGNEACRIFEENNANVDMLLTDIIMPGMSGVKLAEILKSKKAGLKVLLTSGYAEEIVRKKDLLKPDVEFLEKPIIPSLLTQKIRCMFDSGKG